jgi:rhamnogalacturonyl hydrolase YesR
MTLEQIEAEIRDISTDLWVHTVDDPETATVTSEAEGMTPERYERSKITARLTALADKVERLINNQPLVIDGVEITDPTMSPCGRFPVKQDGGGQ